MSKIYRSLLLLSFLLLLACANSEASKAPDEFEELEKTSSLSIEVVEEAETAVSTQLPLSQPETTPESEPVSQFSTGWQRTNPGGGGAFATIGAGPTGIILAASDLAGAYRSLDGGQNWDLIGSFRDLTTTHVSSIGFDPLDEAILYLGTEDGIFRSNNRGDTVSQVLSEGYITDIEIAQNNTKIGYAAYHSAFDINDGRIYKTIDHGEIWKQSSDATLPNGLHILKVIIDPTNHNNLYLLAGEGRFTCGPAAIYRSQDGGVSWTQLASDKGQIMDIVLDQNNPNSLFITTYGDVWDEGYTCINDDPNGGYLYQSTNFGDSWLQLTTTQQNALIWLDHDDQQAIRLINVDYPEIIESIDNGVFWTTLGDKSSWETGWTGTEFAYGGSFNGDTKTIGFDLSDPDALLWIDSQFAFATRDDGRSFSNIYTNEVVPNQWQSRGIDNIVTFEAAFSADSSHIYLAMPDTGCFRSPDAGLSWQNCNDANYVGTWNGNGGNAMTVATDPERANIVWISLANEIEGDSHTLLRSEDFGQTWQNGNSGLPSNSVYGGLTVDSNSPSNDRTLYLTAGSDVYRSVDDGTSWSLLFACGGCHETAVSPANSNILFTGGEAGLFRSTDGGNSWVEVGSIEMRGSLGAFFWDSYWEGVSTIKIDPNNPEWVYTAVFGQDRGLYLSKSNGDIGSWEKLFNDDFLQTVAIHPAESNKLYLGSASATYAGGYDSNSSGFLYSEDGGETWTPMNDGLAWPFVNVIEIDLNNSDKLFVGSPGGGYYWQSIFDIQSTTYLPIVLSETS